MHPETRFLEKGHNMHYYSSTAHIKALNKVKYENLGKTFPHCDELKNYYAPKGIFNVMKYLIYSLFDYNSLSFAKLINKRQLKQNTTSLWFFSAKSSR